MSVLRTLKGKVHRQWIELKMQLGLETSIRTPDRTVLEQLILPYFANTQGYDKILFVGCEWYTKHYEKLFCDKEYWTIEINPESKRYGASHHVVDSITNLNSHFDRCYFDAIVYTGVFGWGVNTKQDADDSFEQCFRCLRECGVLVFGWNNVPSLSPFPPEDCLHWQHFQPYIFPSLARSEYVVPDSFQNFTFRFLQKPALALNRSL